MTECAGITGGIDEAQLRRVRRFSLFVAVILALLFAASVYLFSRHGGGFVDGLSSQVGEVVAARAKSLADSGQPEEAAKLYAAALRAEFENPQQRVWCYRRYGETLVELQRWNDAAEAFEAAIALNAKDWPSHRQLCEALKQQGLDEAVRNAARRWQQTATGINEAAVKSAERYLKSISPQPAATKNGGA